MSWAPSPAAAAGGAVGGAGPQDQGPGGQRRPRGQAGAGAASALRRYRSVSGVLSLAGALVIWLALLGPVIALLANLSGHAIVSALTGPGNLDPLVTSLASAGVTMAVLLVLCTPLAWMLARGSLPFPRVWEAGVLCMLLLPPLVIGLLLIFMVGPYTPIGDLLNATPWHISVTNTFLALVIAEVYESAPYYLVGAQSAFADVDPRMEQQAALLGDRPLRVLRRVTLPLAAPGLAMALAVAWARAMGAFGAVIIIAYHPYGLPLWIWLTQQETGLASALPYALFLVVVALPLPLIAFTWSARARRRRRG